MEIKGTIILDLPKVEGISKAGNPWKKKEWVLETVDTQFPRKVMFHFFGDRAETPLEVGHTYVIQCEPESREFNGRWYTDIRGISATPVDAGFGPAPQAGFSQAQQQFGAAAPAAQPGYPQAPQTDFTANDAEGDLPF